MAFNDLVLSFLAFPQQWNPGAIDLRFLVLPSSGDPLQALIASGPQFAGTAYSFQPYFIPGLDALPDLSVAPIPLTFAAAPAFNAALAASLFTNFKSKYGVTANPLIPVASAQIKKSLPPSYQIASGFAQSQSGLFSNDKDFGCSVHGKDPGTSSPPPAKTLSWGQLYSFALRQPRLAMGLGLLFEASVKLTPAQAANGGWLFVNFATGSNPYQVTVAANPDLVRSFAARIPALAAAQRTLFASVLFPVGVQPSDIQTLTAAETEAQKYDRGFGLIVHCNQPDSIDAAIGDPNATKPASDAGIQLGWDDVQITTWHNRQLQNIQARVNPAVTPIPLPLGVSGYRVDARETGTNTWNSLHEATSNLSLSLPPDTRPIFEPPIEPLAARALGTDLEAWLPRYFAQWRGGSLGVADSLPQTLIDGVARNNSTVNSAKTPAIALLYGKTYDFRVRYADLTQGGPLPSEQSDNTDSGMTTCNFKRYVPPKSLRTQVKTGPAGTITSINVWRPIISYPEFAFTGIAIPNDFAARALKAKQNLSVFGPADTDVTAVKVTVEARTPAHDTGDPATLDGPFRFIYDVTIPLPVSAGDLFSDPPPATDALALDFQYVDVKHISQLAAPAVSGGHSQTIPLPRARDLRVRLQPIASHANPDTYFGNNAQIGGVESHYDTRSDAAGVENQLFDPTTQPVDLARAFFFQLGDNIPQRLANELDLQVDGLTLSGRAGQRLVFGASPALRHTLSGDHSAITFAALTELLNHWVVALRVSIDRDWTWDGLASESFAISGDFNKQNGVVEIRRTVSAAAIQGVVNREATEVIYFDSVSPAAEPGKFPVAPFVTWTVTPSLQAGLSPTDPPLTIPVHLPKAANPAQVPTIASAGIALTPYQAATDYSSTSPRQKSLWVEFTEPIADPDDTYFARVLAYSPDPILAPFTHPPLPVEPALPIDPEPVRIIVPGQSADTSGLTAMQQMTKSTDSDRHYLMPLPPGIGADARELFGFWTYEVRVGHAGNDLAHWSTAQARFGRPLRVTGVQHPAPLLQCYPYRDTKNGVSVRVPFASPVFDGKRLISGGDFSPRSEVWVLLYAQVMQADGASFRNVLILEAAAQFNPQSTQIDSITGDPFGVAMFAETGSAGITTALSTLSLPHTASLSVLAVELLPSEGARSQDATIRCSLSSRRILRTSPLTAVNAVC